MFRTIGGGLLALAGVLCAHDRASAWVNFKFSAGINWQYQSGGNNLLWGAWQSAQPGGPCFPAAHAAAANPGQAPAQANQGLSYPAHPHQGQPYYGYAPPNAQPMAPQFPATAPAQPKAAATTTSQPSQPSPGDSYSNFYGQFYYYQPGYYPTSYELPQYRLGLSFER